MSLKIQSQHVWKEPSKLSDLLYDVDSPELSFAAALLDLRGSSETKPFPDFSRAYTPPTLSFTEEKRSDESDVSKFWHSAGMIRYQSKEDNTGESKVERVDNMPPKKRRVIENALTSSSGSSTIYLSRSHGLSSASMDDTDDLKCISLNTQSSDDRLDSTSMDSEDYRKARGKYKCGRCGQPKTNHVCLMAEDTPAVLVSTGTQAVVYAISDLAKHPFITERTITVSVKSRSTD